MSHFKPTSDKPRILGQTQLTQSEPERCSEKRETQREREREIQRKIKITVKVSAEITEESCWRIINSPASVSYIPMIMISADPI
jgi:hypothetical protein